MQAISNQGPSVIARHELSDTPYICALGLPCPLLHVVTSGN